MTRTDTSNARTRAMLVHFPPAEHQHVLEEAEARGWTAAQLIREALNRYIGGVKKG